jgi:hypothetical protein
MDLDLRSLMRGLEYHGQVTGKRRTYYVLSSTRQYFVMSLSDSKPGSGNFNLVSKASVERLHHRIRGQQGLTSKHVSELTRSRGTVSAALAALNMLYVLVGTDRATIDQRHRSRELFFNVRW